MGKIVGIRFKPQGKTYDFDPGAYVLNSGDRVVVETEQGLGFGTVATPPRNSPVISGIRPLRGPSWSSPHFPS